MQTGILKKEGFSSLTKFGVKIRTEHPKTKVIFENFTIPFFKEASELVKRAAGFMPGICLVGWDDGI